MTSSLSKVLRALLPGLTIALLLGGCANAQDRAVRPDTGGKPGAAASAYALELVVTVTPQGKVQLLSRDGRSLTRCQLCNEELQAKFGTSCEKAATINPPICMATTGATLAALEHFSVIISKSNPSCGTIFIGGTAYQVRPCW